MKEEEDREIKKVMAGIKKNLAKKSWPCIVAGCDQIAINSHLLQRHGVLNNIVENGHCYEMRETDLYGWTQEQPPVAFRRCGLQNALSLPIFCNHHDTELFKPIEIENVDYTDYRNQILLSYRALCAELRRKEIVIDRYKRYLGSNTLSTYRSSFSGVLRDSIKWNEIGINDILYYKQLIEEELDTPAGNFIFVHHTYSIKGIYASSSFTIASAVETADQSEPLDDCFGHVIPCENHTELVFGYHKGHVNDRILDFMNGWGGLNNEELGERLTGWFTLIESWGLAPSLYEKIAPEKLKHFFELFENSVFWVGQNPNVGFNLFSGLL